jgi:hypothetical protein
MKLTTIEEKIVLRSKRPLGRGMLSFKGIFLSQEMEMK